MTGDTQDDPEDDDGLPAAGPQRLICQPGRPVFEQGAPAHQAFYVEEGRVEVTVKEDGHVVRLAEIGPGEIFGEMGVLEKEMRMATITAMEKCVLTIISRRDLEDRIAAIDVEIVRSLISVLIRRLRESSREQVRYYRELAVFQDRLAGLMADAGAKIDPARRKAFSAEIMPLMREMEQVLEKYKS